MQKSVAPNSTIRSLRLLLMLTCILLGFLPVSFVIAADGDFVWAKASDADASGGGAFGMGVAIDTSGNVCTTGHFFGTVDFDPGPSTFSLTSNGAEDIFISKLDSNGNFIWVKKIGELSSDRVSRIALDASGNIYIMGSFDGIVDFDPGPDTFNLTNSGGGASDIFICKLDSNGNFIWATAASTNGFAMGAGMGVDPSGNVYITGYFYNTVDFDPGPDTLNITSARLADIFISKFNSSGNFVWAKSFMGASWDDFGYGIAVDGSGNIYTTGYFSAPLDFDPGPETFILTNSGKYVSKLDTDGDFVWAKEMNGGVPDIGEGITVDGSGNVYTTGDFRGTVDFDPGSGTFNLTSGNRDMYISKLDIDGNFVWAKTTSAVNPGGAEGFGIAVDGSGNVYTHGQFNGSVDFDPGPETFNLDASGGGSDYDIFISKLDSSGNFVWAKAFDAPVLANIEVRDIVVNNSAGNVYGTGIVSGTIDFDPGEDVFNLSGSMSFGDFFVVKLSGSQFQSSNNSGFPWVFLIRALDEAARNRGTQQ